MKGVLDFLEKAGLVKQESPAIPDAHSVPAAVPASVPAPPSTAPLDQEAAPNVSNERPSDVATLNLLDVYAHAGVPASLYPAERLLRLIDGLSAMDEATRKLAIKAMDEADESWTIADPLRDADAKLMALADHGQKIQQELQALEAETEQQIAVLRERQSLRVGEIKKQMSELEALLAREVARGDSECSIRETRLGGARDQVAATLNEITLASRALRRLGEQFGPQHDSSTDTSPNRI